MMKNLSKNNNLLLLDILHKFIFSKKGGASITDVDANTLELLCREADDNLLGSLLYFYCGKDNILPEFWQKKWSLDFIKNSADELRQAEELTSILKLLADNDIEVAPLKGACLAYTYYPHPALRSMSDFDILVKPESIQKAFQVMLDNNFTSDYKFGSHQHTHHEPQLFSSSGFMVELHSHITPNSVRCDYNLLWENCYKSELKGQVVTFLSPEIYLLHAIDHAFRDRLVGGFKAFIDSAYILAKSNMNITELKNCAKKLGFYDEFTLFMNVFPKFFPKKYIPDTEQISANLIDVAHYLASNFKTTQNIDAYQVMLHRDYNNLTLSGKFIFIIKKMKFSPKDIAKKYECRLYSPMLIFYYFHRAYRYFIKLIMFKKESKPDSLSERIGIYQKKIHCMATNQGKIKN